MEHILEMGAVMAICNGVGAALKAHPRVKHYNIPFILLGIGILAGGIYGQSVESAMQGAVAALASVGVHQGAKQAARAGKP
jgi:hypothetical protein